MTFGNLKVQTTWEIQTQKKDIIGMDCKETDEDSSEPVSGFCENQELTGLLVANKGLSPKELGYTSYC